MAARRLVALLVAAGLALSSAGCGGGEQLDAVDADLIAPSTPRDEVAEVQPWSKPETQRRTIKVGQRDRSFLLSLPAGARERSRLPLIFAFHGYREDAASMRKYSQLDGADAIVVYMDGVDRAWAPAPYARTTGGDDLAFVDAVREQVTGEFSVDKARVFATGLSNGGGFASYVGCQRPQDFTAVASVSAAFYQRVSQGCSSIPIKHVDFHGTNDSVMSYFGGQRHDTAYESVEAMLAEAAERNHCDAEYVEKPLSDTVTELRWDGCDAPLVHYRVDGGPHIWQGGTVDSSRTTSAGFATRTLLAFFGVPFGSVSDL